MTMIERVARAICEGEYGDANAGWENKVPAARAAIEAMRDLPIGFDMIGAVELVKHSKFSLAYRAVVAAMLIEGGTNAD